MARRGVLLVVFCLVGLALAARDESQNEARLLLSEAWKSYLNETVRRGLPLLAVTPAAASTPYWPVFDDLLRKSTEIAESDDARYLKALGELHQGRLEEASQALETSWTKQNFFLFSKLQVGNAFLKSLFWLREDQQLQSVWTTWEQKYLSADALLTGIASMERSSASAVPVLLYQVSQLYPGDQRFYPFFLLHVDAFPQTTSVLKKSLQESGGLSEPSMRQLLRRLDRDPVNRAKALPILWNLGYRYDDLIAACHLQGITQGSPTVVGNDYSQMARGLGQTNSSESSSVSGVFGWDIDGDGFDDAVVTLENGQLISWSQGFSDPRAGRWIAHFHQGQVTDIRESRLGETWILSYEEYPFANGLVWESGTRRIQYRFAPFEISVPLWDSQRQKVPQALWPLNFQSPWKSLNPAALIAKALRCEEWNAGVLVRRLHLLNGQVWLGIEDLNADGRPDTWTYYRAGKVASVYQNFEEVPQADLLEIYKEGQLNQVLVDANRNGKAEFALFPKEDVQLWDWNETGTPFLRIFRWDGSDELKAVILSSSALPAMPGWEARPWP